MQPEVGQHRDILGRDRPHDAEVWDDNGSMLVNLFRPEFARRRPNRLDFGQRWSDFGPNLAEPSNHGPTPTAAIARRVRWRVFCCRLCAPRPITATRNVGCRSPDLPPSRGCEQPGAEMPKVPQG